jgi:hypothetical protein
MSARKSTCLVPVLFCCTWLLRAPANAGELPADVPTGPQKFQVSFVNQSGPAASEQSYRACVSVGTNKFSFGAPPNFRVDAYPEKILFNSTDYSCFLTFRIMGSAQLDSEQLKTDSYRELLLSRYPGAKILSEFSISAANRSGPAFDLQWRNSGGVMQSARVAFVPNAAGVLEFTLIARADRFSEGQQSFNAMLSSFIQGDGSKSKFPPTTTTS